VDYAAERQMQRQQPLHESEEGRGIGWAVSSEIVQVVIA
jgi:hypothetical protein